MTTAMPSDESGRFDAVADPPLAPLVEVLHGDQRALVAKSGKPDRLHQPGGAVLPGPFTVAAPQPADPVHPAANGDRREPLLDTFVVTADGTATAMGIDAAVVAWWQPLVDAMVARILPTMAELGVELEFPAYLTASATPVEDVATGPHFDDDQPRLDDGVGVVIIAASHGGPRLLVEPMACEPVRPPVPLTVDPQAAAAFDRPGAPEVQRTASDRLVIFPRFGQVHSGPRLDDETAAAGDVRNLLVFRTGTVPQTKAQLDS